MFPKKPLFNWRACVGFPLMVILLILSNSFVFSSTLPGAASPITLSGFIPPRQTYHAEALTFGLKIHTSFIYDITVAEENGNVQITATSPDFRFTGNYDPFLRLMYTTTTYSNPQAMELQGYDQRNAFYDPQAKRVTLKYFSGIHQISTKTFSYDERMVDSEAFFIYLQGMLLKGVKDIHCGILLKLKGMKLDAAFKLWENVKLEQLGPQTKYPEFFQDLLQGSELFDVYEMRLTGIVGLFYPYKFYFAYHKSPSGLSAAGRLAAYWGGAGEDEEYYRFK